MLREIRSPRMQCDDSARAVTSRSGRRGFVCGSLSLFFVFFGFWFKSVSSLFKASSATSRALLVLVYAPEENSKNQKLLLLLFFEFCVELYIDK